MHLLYWGFTVNYNNWKNNPGSFGQKIELLVTSGSSENSLLVRLGKKIHNYAKPQIPNHECARQHHTIKSMTGYWQKLKHDKFCLNKILKHQPKNWQKLFKNLWWFLYLLLLTHWPFICYLFNPIVNTLNSIPVFWHGFCCSPYPA